MEHWQPVNPDDETIEVYIGDGWPESFTELRSELAGKAAWETNVEGDDSTRIRFLEAQSYDFTYIAHQYVGSEKAPTVFRYHKNLIRYKERG